MGLCQWETQKNSTGKNWYIWLYKFLKICITISAHITFKSDRLEEDISKD